jgi:hypothetical protein
MVGLHGYNTNGEVFDYQSMLFKEKFRDVMEFYTFEAPHNAPDQPI